MRWITEQDGSQDLMFTVTFILDFITVTTTLQGRNDWEEGYVLHTANQHIKDEYSFAPYDFMWSHEIEVEVI